MAGVRNLRAGRLRLGPSAVMRISDAAVMGVLFLLAFWIRIQFFPSPTYGDEGQHWFHSAHWLARRADNVADPYGATWFHPWWAMLQRPVWYLFYQPFAEQGFTTMRIAHAVVTSLLPAAGYGWLRARRAPAPVAALGGALVALHPVVAAYSTLLLMDGDMTLLLVAGLWAREAKRPLAAAALFLASIWTKEIAFFFVLGLFVWEMAEHRASWWPMRPTRTGTALLVPMILGLAPLMVSLSQGLQPPGGARDHAVLATIEGATGSAWLLIALLAGLASRRARLPAAAALFFVVLLAAMSAVGRAVEIWYYTPALALTMLAVPLCLYELWRRASRIGSRRHALTAAGGAIVAVVLVLSLIAVPMAAQPGIVRPLTLAPKHSLPEAIEWETEMRDAAFVHAVQRMDLDGTQNVTTIDVFYPLVLHPIAPQARHVTTIYPWYPYFFNGTWGPHISAIAEADWLLVAVVDWPLHDAVDRTYAECRVMSQGEYRLYDVAMCPARGEQLLEAFHNEANEIGYQVR